MTAPNKQAVAQTLADEQQAMQVAEAAREKKWAHPSFLKELFLGNVRWSFIDPFPKLKGMDSPEFKNFHDNLKKFLREEVDPEQIDRDGKVPDTVRKKLAHMGAFGLKIAKQYGGQAFTQAEYNTLLKLIGSHDSNLVALLSAHQSIGVPQPLILFGTEEQKQKYLPRVASGQVSAFALTEPNVGSDPANLTTNVRDSADGNHFILNGKKLWCTNGTIADVIVVMARHAEDNTISAFIVEMNWEGVMVDHRCRFMGLKAIENAVVSFKGVKVPKENLLWKRGKGLKLALITLNTGRLALPAVTTGSAKLCLQICRHWANKRFQWGQPIGKHDAIAQKIAWMAETVFAMESISDLATALYDQKYDIRLEAAVAKMYNTEMTWKITDETLQIRGGRGYETTESLRARGEAGIPVERMLRDCRINLIFEGTSEIMRLFIAREAVDKHLEVAGTLVDPKSSVTQKLKVLPKIALFYLWWYPRLWLAWDWWPRQTSFGHLASQARFAGRTARRLARQIFHGMLVHGPALQRKQAFLFRVVDIGAEIYAMCASVSRAKKLMAEGNQEAAKLAHHFCSDARLRIQKLFKDLWHNHDDQNYKLAREILNHKHTWLEEGIVGLTDEQVQGMSPE